MTTPKYSKIGITTAIPDDVEPIGVYESDGGIEVFPTDSPYLLEDGGSLLSPVPVIVVDGPVYTDKLGNARQAWPVTGIGPPPSAGITWDSGQTWDSNTYWSS